MTYYVRHTAETVVQGPYTTEQLSIGVQQGRISPDSLVSAADGAPITTLQRYRRCDWAPLASVPGLDEVIPPLERAPRGTDRVLHGFRLIVLPIVCAANAGSFLLAPQWRTGLGAVCFGFIFAVELRQYLTEKPLHGAESRRRGNRDSLAQSESP